MRIPRAENIAPLVHSIRGERVLFDADLAILYGVLTRVLNQAVKRNRNRFPADFMFQLTDKEWAAMRSQTVTASSFPGKALPKRRIGFIS
jgi:ORF6N domain-containing protein